MFSQVFFNHQKKLLENEDLSSIFMSYRVFNGKPGTKQCKKNYNY